MNKLRVVPTTIPEIKNVAYPAPKEATFMGWIYLAIANIFRIPASLLREMED